MEIQIIKLEKSRLNEILAIEKSSFKEPWKSDFFEKEIGLPFSHFYVALAGPKVIGYAGFWEMGEQADIINLAVHPDFRKKGIGKKILRFIFSRAEDLGIKKVFLEVRNANAAAQKLYSSCGFKTVGKRKKYYRDDDALIMEKEINGA